MLLCEQYRHRRSALMIAVMAGLALTGRKSAGEACGEQRARHGSVARGGCRVVALDEARYSPCYGGTCSGPIAGQQRLIVVCGASVVFRRIVEIFVAVIFGVAVGLGCAHRRAMRSLRGRVRGLTRSTRDHRKAEQHRGEQRE